MSLASLLEISMSLISLGGETLEGISGSSHEVETVPEIPDVPLIPEVPGTTSRHVSFNPVIVTINFDTEEASSSTYRCNSA